MAWLKSRWHIFHLMTGNYVISCSLHLYLCVSVCGRVAALSLSHADLLIWQCRVFTSCAITSVRISFRHRIISTLWPYKFWSYLTWIQPTAIIISSSLLHLNKKWNRFSAMEKTNWQTATTKKIFCQWVSETCEKWKFYYTFYWQWWWWLCTWMSVNSTHLHIFIYIIHTRFCEIIYITCILHLKSV